VCRGVRRVAGRGNRRQATRTGVRGDCSHRRRLRSTRDRGLSAGHTAQRRVHPQADQQGERRWFVHVRVRSVGRQLQSGDPRCGGQRQGHVRVRGRRGAAKARVVLGQQLVRIPSGRQRVTAAVARPDGHVRGADDRGSEE